jgi:hypothetical protein
MEAETRTDQQGSFVFKNVVPGAYIVMADTADDEQVVTGDTDENGESGEEPVTLRTAEKKHMQLSLTKAQ